MAAIPRFGVSNRFREAEEAPAKNGSRFFSKDGSSGDTATSNLVRNGDSQSRPLTGNTQQTQQEEKSRRRQAQLQRFLPQSWVGALQRRWRHSNSKSSTLTSSRYSEEAGSMLSMPASYSGYYEYVVSDEDDSDDGILSVGTLSELGVKTEEYVEYANLETFRSIPKRRKKKEFVVDDKRKDDDEEVTPTNTPIPVFTWPKDLENIIVEEKERKKVSRLQSMRDTKRRMRAIAQVPNYIFNASDIGPDEDARLGFANIPDQMHRKAVKKGFNFTLMIAGESGLGKATLVNSLFMQDLYNDRESASTTELINKVTTIEKRQIELDERGVKLRLTIVDTPGFNDALNAEDCWKPIEEYIDGTFEQYFKDECGLNRKNIQDNRVHCCLYFISPYGHGLRQVDVEFMRHLQTKVNIVPVIAKADALTATELRIIKDRIMSDLDRYKIDIYRLPECDSDEEDEIKRLDKDIKSVLPFAVIGSNCVVEDESGKRVRGRQYPWGVVEVENPRHCDFTKLRIFLLKTHMQDLKDMTLEVHYENYRAKYITERMSKRQTDRREAGAIGNSVSATSGSLRTDRENVPGFEAIVGADCLMRKEGDEVKMHNLSAKTLDFNSRGKTDSINGGTNGTNQSAVRSTMSGPGTLPPKATGI